MINAPFHSQEETNGGEGLKESQVRASPFTVNSSLRLSRDSHVTSAATSATSDQELDLKAPAPSGESLYQRQTALGLTANFGTPSEILIAALGTIGQQYVKPEVFSKKKDLSHWAPISVGEHGKHGIRSARKHSLSLRDPKATTRLVLAQYIQNLHPLVNSPGQNSGLLSQRTELDSILLQIFNDETSKVLQAKGWHVSDLMSWTWILTAESSERAATRLMMLASPPAGTSSTVVPTFVFLLLLRRKDMTIRALRLLIIHAWNCLQGRPSAGAGWVNKSDHELENAAIPRSWSEGMRIDSATRSLSYLQMSETTVMTMLVRLLRHCRKLWPVAFVSIATMLTKHVAGISSGTKALPAPAIPEQTFARLTFLYNRALSLLSIPSSMNPLQSVAYHQRAQFTILRRMNEFEPALAVDREGYRAVTRVQLAHGKTLREREWADMKAKSWPPWKEEKLGLDVNKGPEYGISRAGETIYRLKEGGYAPQDWESAATILAGWDTDRSPTIQTRSQFQKPLLPRRVMSFKTANRPERDRDVWAARIKATRTLDEGWVCFLAYMDQRDNPSQAPYYAMFERLVFEAKRRRQSDTNANTDFATGDSNTLPGDGKEVCLKPEDPRVSIYVRTPLPSIEGFFDDMIKDKVLPSGRFLGFLLSHAGSFRAGMKYLRSSSLPPRIFNALLNLDLNADSGTRAELESVPDQLFAAFIRFLSRFAPTSSSKSIDPVDNLTTSSTYRGHSRISRTRPRASPMNPLLHAFRLMACRKPYYRPPWNSLLSALARAGTIVDSGSTVGEQSVQDIWAWNILCDLLHQMREIGLDLDLQGFQIVCVALEKAVLASESLIQASKKPVVSPVQESGAYESTEFPMLENHTRVRLDAEQVLLHGLPHVKKIFKDLVEPDVVQGDSASSDSSEVSSWVQDHGTLAPSALLPRLLEVPVPSQLHAFIRVLGLRADYSGLLDLMQWMSRFAPELRAAADEAANGASMTRRCVVAMRVFLERCWSDGAENGSKELKGNHEGGPEEVIEKVYEIIEGNEQWGGWPSDEEVEKYCRRGRFV